MGLSNVGMGVRRLNPVQARGLASLSSAGMSVCLFTPQHPPAAATLMGSLTEQAPVLHPHIA
eukprot:1161734-Pelagomonas_calceolata.AAC.3